MRGILWETEHYAIRGHKGDATADPDINRGDFIIIAKPISIKLQKRTADVVKAYSATDATLQELLKFRRQVDGSFIE